jgi:hypothetical protein
MGNRITAPHEIAEPFYQAELGLSYENLIALERDRGSEAVRKAGHISGSIFMLGRPQAWCLGEDGEHQLLIQIACSFLAARGHQILSARFEACFEAAGEAPACLVQDLYPRRVEEAAQRTIWVAKTETGFRVFEELPRLTGGFVVDGLDLRPKVIAAGLGTATGIWDYFGLGEEPVAGCKVGYLVVKADRSATALKIRFAVSAVVETPLGILPFTVEKQLTESSECALELHGLSRMARTGAYFHSDPAQVAAADKIKILFLAANPWDTTPLSLDEEARAIDEALRRSALGHRFEIRQHWAVRIDDLQGLILRHDPDIVHFSGHGSQAGEILLEDESRGKHLVSPAALSGLFSVLRGKIRCVLLNACLTVQQAQAIAQHVDGVIGMSREIEDAAAVTFAAGFYQALGFGKDVKTAFELGRNLLDLKNLEDKDVPRLFAERTDPRQIRFLQSPALPSPGRAEGDGRGPGVRD